MRAKRIYADGEGAPQELATVSRRIMQYSGLLKTTAVLVIPLAAKAFQESDWKYCVIVAKR